MSLVLNSVLPIFAVIGLGTLLKRLRLIDETFIGVSDKLIYYIFFPMLLFWKIGKPAEAAAVDWLFILSVLVSVFTVFAISLAIVTVLRTPHREVGSFSQGCYRFSSYIGLAVILTALGEEGVRDFGVLIGFVIPFINVLAVSSMIWYSEQADSQEPRKLFFLKSVASNPLILACLLGILYSNLGLPLPIFVDKTLGLASMLALPLALISIGSSLTFSKFREHITYSWIAALCKLVLLPLVGYFFLKKLQVGGSTFQIAMIYFALPTSPQNYILSSQLNSDVDLATSAIVLSTVLSVVSLSAIIFIFVG
ncbi:MAG TPA: AEC family transporter [Desulfomonilaceae bacterium]|nr:AEC family transporter [Desulfomonilaceae bacterium]